MRITGGKAGGIGLRSPRGERTRPATDRLRESVFAIIAGRVADARFLDLFAGTGAYGLEAWSRGADGGIFVERNRAALAALRENVESVARSLGADAGAVRVMAKDALRWTPPPGERFDLIFCDPPYELIAKAAPVIFSRAREWLTENGALVFEAPGEAIPPAGGWRLIKQTDGGRHQPVCRIYTLETQKHDQ